MKISDAIAKLEEIKNEYGDITIRQECQDYSCDKSIDYIIVKKASYFYHQSFKEGEPWVLVK